MGILDSLLSYLRIDGRWGRGELPIERGPTILDTQPQQEEKQVPRCVGQAPLRVGQDPPEPWFTMRCGVCDHDVQLYIDINVNELNPFNSTVLTTQCEQCAARIAVVIPPVQITEADTLTLREVDLIHDGYPD